MPRTAALVAFAATISNAGCNAWPALPPHTKEAALEHWSSFYAASSEDLYGLLGVPRKAGKRSLRWAFRSRCVQKLRRSADSELSDFFEMARAWDVLGDPDRRREYDTGASRLRQETAWRLLRLPALKRLVAEEAARPRRFCRRAADRRWWREELEAATQARALALSEGEGAPATTWADMAWTASVAALVGGLVQLVRGLPPRRRRDGRLSMLGLLHEAGAMADRVLEFYLQDMRAAGLTVCAVVSWAVLGKAAVLVLHENIGDLAAPCHLRAPPPFPPTFPRHHLARAKRAARSF